jgi:hypothetical protein
MKKKDFKGCKQLFFISRKLASQKNFVLGLCKMSASAQSQTTHTGKQISGRYNFFGGCNYNN